MKNIKKLSQFKRRSSAIALAFLSASAMAQATEPVANAATTPPTDFTTFTWWLIIAAMVILLVAIAVLGNVLVTMAKISAPRVKNIVAILFVLATLSVTAQETATVAPAAVKTSSMFDNFGIYLAATILLVEFFVLIMLARKIYSFAKVYYEEEEKAKAVKIRKPSFLDRFNASVAVDKEQDIVLDHDYDGIKELDNDLPPWWKYGFYISIVWAVVYFGYYELGGGPTSIDEYNTAMEKAEAEVTAYKAKHVIDVDENNVLLADAAGIKAGKTIFESNCAVCHGKEAEGVVGPNLTDDYWLHGGSLKDIFKTVKYGVIEKGMTSWKDILSPADILNVSSYVKSLHGTRPANAKAPDGELYKEEASAALADSSVAAK